MQLQVTQERVVANALWQRLVPNNSGAVIAAVNKTIRLIAVVVVLIAGGCASMGAHTLIRTGDGAVLFTERVLPPCPKNVGEARLRLAGAQGSIPVRLSDVRQDGGGMTTVGCADLQDLPEPVRDQMRRKGYKDFDKAYFKVFGDETQKERVGELLPYDEAVKESKLTRSIEFYSAPGQKSRVPYSFEMSGRNQVRVQNPNAYGVTVMLRTGRNGKDFLVSAGGSQAVSVPDGRYDIYFQYSNEPSGLFQGDSFNLNGNRIEIRLVQAVGGNYGVRRVE